MSTGRKLLGAATLVAAGGILSRLLGLIRDPVMAQFFGRSTTTDIFVAAQSLSTVVYDLLVSGLVSAALIPTLSRLADREERETFWRVANAVFAIGAVVLTLVVLLLLLTAPWLVDVMSGGYSAAALARETVLARLMIPTVLLMGLSAIATAILYSLQRYRVAALAVASVNAGTILGMLLLHRAGIVSAAIGLLGGGALQLVLQLAALANARMPFRPRLDFRMPEIRHIGKLYVPVAASVLITGTVVVVERHLYSLAGSGSLSASYYATRLVQVPLGLVSTAISMAILPTISRYAEAADWLAYRRTLGSGLKIAVLLTLPLMVALAVLGRPMVALVFQHGQFSAADAVATTWAFWFNAPLIPFVAADQLLIAAFYARHDTRTPTAVAFVTALVWLLVAVVGLRLADWRALVLANTVQNCAHAIILYGLLLRREPAMARERVRQSWGRAAAAAVLMAVVCAAAGSGLRGILGTSKVADLLLLVIAGGGSTLVYLGVLALWQSDEVALVRRTFSRQAA